MSKTALIITHKVHEDIGSLKNVLDERWFTLDQRLGYHDTLAGEDPLRHDLTIFMGGTMGVYQKNMFPYLEHEISYLKKRIAADKPTLGICLGAQLIAAACEKDVYKGTQGPEVGWREISINEAGQNTPVKHLDKNHTKMMQWHGDTFDLPDEALLLASSEAYKNQAYAIGKNILGLQCHPEVTSEKMEFWMAIGVNELTRLSIDVNDLRDQSAQNGPILEQQTKQFFNEWLDEVMGDA